MMKFQKLKKKIKRKRKHSGAASSKASNTATTSTSGAATSPIYPGYIPPPPQDINALTNELMKDTTKKGRSGTTLNKFFRRASNNKIQVYHNQYGQPIGEGSAKFRSTCGVIARLGRLCPLTYPRWNKMPSTYKELHVKFLKLYFIFDEDAMESFIKKSIGQKWKYWKNTVHGFVDLSQSLEYNMEKEIDARVDPHQWKQLVPLWFDKDYQEKVSGKAKEYKFKQKIFHTCGRTPFAQLREDKGYDMGDIEFFQYTHTKKDGSVDLTAAAILEQCKNIIEERNLEIDEVHSNIDLQSQIFSKLTTKEGYKRSSGWGLGPTPSTIYGSNKVNKSDIEKIQKHHEVEMEKMKAQVEEIKEKHKIEMVEMEVKMEAKMKSEMMAQLKVQKKKLDEQMKDMFGSYMAAIKIKEIP